MDTTSGQNRLIQIKVLQPSPEMAIIKEYVLGSDTKYEHLKFMEEVCGYRK